MLDKDKGHRAFRPFRVHGKSLKACYGVLKNHKIMALIPEEKNRFILE